MWFIILAVLLAGGPAQQDLRAIEKQTFEAVNRQRTDHGLRPLEWNEQLAKLARAHSKSMAQKGYFSHAGPRGDLAERLDRAGVRWEHIGENIQDQQGFEHPVEQGVQAWMNSPGHRRNILDPAFTETGVGVAQASNGMLYFTQEFVQPPQAQGQR